MNEGVIASANVCKIPQILSNKKGKQIEMEK